MLADKQAVLDRGHAAPHCTRRPVGPDLALAVPAPLAAAGFDPGALTVFVAEGLSWYLPGQAALHFAYIVLVRRCP